MKNLMTRCLLVSTLTFLLGCAAAPPNRQLVQIDIRCIEKFKPTFKSELYNASVDVVGKHLSGLVLFKSMPDSSVRVVFTNEAGIKFFDLGFQRDGSFVAHQVMRKLNKKVVVRTLQNDFELTLMRRVGRETPEVFKQGDELFFSYAGKKDEDRIVTSPDCTRLIRIEKGTNTFKKTTVTLMGQQTVPDSILVQHHNFNMTIKLKRLERL
jgi:hypothetical protein